MWWTQTTQCFTRITIIIQHHLCPTLVLKALSPDQASLKCQNQQTIHQPTSKVQIKVQSHLASLIMEWPLQLILALQLSRTIHQTFQARQLITKWLRAHFMIVRVHNQRWAVLVMFLSCLKNLLLCRILQPGGLQEWVREVCTIRHKFQALFRRKWMWGRQCLTKKQRVLYWRGRRIPSKIIFLRTRRAY